MTITILEDVDKIDMGQNDVRSFAKGDAHVLSPEHEQRLIELGLAVPAIPEEQKAALAAAVEELVEEKLKEPATAE